MDTDRAAKRFAYNLRTAINQKGWNLKRAAAETGLKEVWVRKAVTKGVKRPTEEQLQKLVAVFGPIHWYDEPQTRDPGDYGRRLADLLDEHPWLKTLIDSLWQRQAPRTNARRANELAPIIHKEHGVLSELDHKTLHELAEANGDDRVVLSKYFARVPRL